MSAYDIIKSLCDKKGIAVTALEKELNFGRGSIGKMRKGDPSAQRLQKIADYFGVSVDYLMTGEEPNALYYLNDDALEAAEFLHRNPKYKVLFEASRKVKEEDIDFVKEMIERMQR